jgi:chaperonin GroES
MGLKPLDDRIVVKRLDSEEKSEGGIFLPDTAKEKPQKGKVVAVGEGKILDSGERSKMILKKGDTILFGKYSGTDVNVDGEELVIMRESEVLAKIGK